MILDDPISRFLGNRRIAFDRVPMEQRTGLPMQLKALLVAESDDGQEAVFFHSYIVTFEDKQLRDLCQKFAR